MGEGSPIGWEVNRAKAGSVIYCFAGNVWDPTWRNHGSGADLDDGALAAAGHTDENEVACVGRVSHDAFELPLQRVRTGQQYAERNIFPTERALYSAGQARIIQPKAVLENN